VRARRAPVAKRRAHCGVVSARSNTSSSSSSDTVQLAKMAAAVPAPGPMLRSPTIGGASTTPTSTNGVNDLVHIWLQVPERNLAWARDDLVPVLREAGLAVRAFYGVPAPDGKKDFYVDISAR
jgi:hypothetical protein